MGFVISSIVNSVDDWTTELAIIFTNEPMQS